MSKHRSRRLFGLLFDLLLIILVLVGISYRFRWTNWNQDADLHPDEYGLTGTLTQLSIPDSLDAYFNTRLSPISPYQKYDPSGQPTQRGPDNRMRWGQWPITLIRWVAEGTGDTGYGEIRLLGRRLSALADALALLLIFLIGRRLYSTRIGLLAAALSALAVMQIQQSHFMTVDNFGTLFTALTLYAAVRASQAKIAGRQRPVFGGTKSSTSTDTPTWVWYVLFGVGLGMAVASRINLLPLAGMILLAALISISEGIDGIGAVQAPKAVRAGFYVALALVVAGVTFRVTQPMSFRAPTGDTTLFTLHPNPDWVDSMEVARNESRGIGAGPPGEQWTNRPAIIFPLVNMVVWGMGLPLGLVAWVGVLWAGQRTLRSVRHTWRAPLLPLVWVGGYFLFMGTRHVTSVRYFLPIYPFLCLFAAWALIRLWRARGPANSAQHDQGASAWSSPTALRRAITPVILLSTVLFGTFAWATAFVDAVYRHDHTRLRASRWMFQNIPAPLNLKIETPAGQYSEPLAAPDGVRIAPEQPYSASFRSPVGGSLQSVELPHARALAPESEPATLQISVAPNPDGQNPLARTTVPATSDPDDARGDPAAGAFDAAPIAQDQTYYVFASVPAGVAAELRRTVISNENWDEALPVRLDGRDPFGQYYTGLTMEVRWPDDENKRQMFLTNLARVEYIILPSQRAIWSISRLPETYPMTMEYYRALFDGRLGFDRVATFTAPLKLGPLYVSDVAGRVGWGEPPELPVFNDSLFAAEEAFSVYDHPPVWVFKKRPDFNIETARAILASDE